MQTARATTATTTERAPLRRDAAANRSRLIAAAVDVFNAEGLDAGVERIASRAGVGVGTLYRRFPTKDTLIAFLVRQMMTDMTEAAIEAEAVPDGRGLEQFLWAAADQLAAHRGCLQRLWKQGKDDTAGLDVLRGHLDRLVRDAQDAGTVRDDISRTDIALIMWSFQGVIDNVTDDPEQACARLLTVVLAGLAPAAAST